jgi:hypothetical protein
MRLIYLNNLFIIHFIGTIHPSGNKKHIQINVNFLTIKNADDGIMMV